MQNEVEVASRRDRTDAGSWHLRTSIIDVVNRHVGEIAADTGSTCTGYPDVLFGQDYGPRGRGFVSPKQDAQDWSRLLLAWLAWHRTLAVW